MRVECRMCAGGVDDMPRTVRIDFRFEYVAFCILIYPIHTNIRIYL